MHNRDLLIVLFSGVTVFSFGALRPLAHNVDAANTIAQLTPMVTSTPTPTVTLVPTSTPTPTPTPVPTATATPTPSLTPLPCEDPEYQYDTYLDEGLIEEPYSYGDRLTAYGGVYYGPSGRETYYNLNMELCVYYMRELGYDEEEYPYWIRDDGAKMLGPYIMVAANWDIRPKGTLLETSLGTGIVVDTGDFIYDYPEGVDIAVDW